jgi:hypothetical protein
MLGEELTRWTIRLALAACVGRWAIDLAGLRDVDRFRADQRRADQFRRCARGLWTAGCVLLWVHVACAFQFNHRWSLVAAYEQTARETAEVTGLNWGGGVWFNFLLMGLWSADVVWWWLAPQSHRRRPKIVEWIWQAYFAFIALCATVLFESGPVRWAGLGAAAGLLALALVRWKVRRSEWRGSAARDR